MFTFAIFPDGREIDNLDAGTYATEAEAQAAGEAALDLCCPAGSPNRRYYRVEVRGADEPRTIGDVAAQFDRLFPEMVDGALAGNGQRTSGHVGDEPPNRPHWLGDDEQWPDGDWATVGFSDAGGDTGHPVVDIHADHIDAAYQALARLSPGCDLDDVQAALRSAGVPLRAAY